MKVLIDGIETPCHSSVKIIYDSLIGGTVMVTESFMAQDNLDTLTEEA